MPYCGIIYYHLSEIMLDEDGCLLPDGHAGPHICRMRSGILVRWEPAFDGCEDCLKDDASYHCISSHILKEKSWPSPIP